LSKLPIDAFKKCSGVRHQSISLAFDHDISNVAQCIGGCRGDFTVFEKRQLIFYFEGEEAPVT